MINGVDSTRHTPYSVYPYVHSADLYSCKQFLTKRSILRSHCVGCSAESLSVTQEKIRLRAQLGCTLVYTRHICMVYTYIAASRLRMR